MNISWSQADFSPEELAEEIAIELEQRDYYTEKNVETIDRR